MPDIHQARQFTDSFIRGFSFVDDIASRRRREKKLDERIAEEREFRQYQKDRQLQIDAERGADRARRIQEEDRLARNRERLEEARKIIAENPTAPDLARLEEYADLPEVLQVIQGRSADIQAEQDARILSGGLNSGLSGQVGSGQPGAPAAGAPAAGQPGAVVDPATQSPGGVAPGLAEAASAEAAQAAQLPGAPGSQEAALAATTDAEIAALMATDPAAAIELRNARDALTKTEFTAPPGGAGPRSDRIATTSPLQESQKKAATKKQAYRDEWEGILDVNDRSFDTFRTAPPSQQVAQYFDARSSLSPVMRKEADAYMAPVIAKTLEEQGALLDDPATTGRDRANATRKYSQALGLANARSETKPLAENGVRSEGLPTNGRNPELTAQVIEGSVAKPGPPLTATTTTQARADQTVINRGASGGRVTERLAQAAWRHHKRGLLSFPEYQSIIRTGKLPANTEFKQWDLEKGPVFAITTDGAGNTQMRMVMPGGKPPTKKEILEQTRNIVSDDSRDFVYDQAEALFGKEKGTELAGHFFAALRDNELTARSRNLDYGVMDDVSLLWRRYKEILGVEQAIEDEWFYDGSMSTDFTQEFGTLGQALFHDFTQEELAELEQPGSTTFGMGGDPVSVTPLPGRDAGFYDYVRQRLGQNISNEDIERLLAEEQAGR